MATFTFTGNKIGLIVRGKTSPTHEPGNMAQHADCVLADGSPIGFFGDEGAATGESTGQGSWNSIGMNMKGLVADYHKLQTIRPYYVDTTLAKRYKVISTVLLIQVTPTEASLFKDYWTKLTLKPGSFHILGANCSTHASEAFVYAGILGGGIPGLDTPNNLYKQLVTVKKGKTESHSGHVGFTPVSTGGYTMTVDTP